MTTRISWSREQLLVAFRLYCRTPFGRLHSRNPDIIQLARLIGRTPSAVAMKACNFASLDPVQQQRNIVALGNASRADRQLWEDFHADPESVAAAAETTYADLAGRAAPPAAEPNIPDGPTEVIRTVRSRRVQAFFRSAVLTSYESRCALTGLAVPELLNASHIIPWSENTARRADPRNGLALNALHDRAFDRGLITFDESLRVVLSPRLTSQVPPPFHNQTLLQLAGRQLNPPTRFPPDPAALAYHREHVFVDL